MKIQALKSTISEIKNIQFTEELPRTEMTRQSITFKLDNKNDNIWENKMDKTKQKPKHPEHSIRDLETLWDCLTQVQSERRK